MTTERKTEKVSDNMQKHSPEKINLMAEFLFNGFDKEHLLRWDSVVADKRYATDVSRWRAYAVKALNLAYATHPAKGG
jgi:hypothetical protein